MVSEFLIRVMHRILGCRSVEINRNLKLYLVGMLQISMGFEITKREDLDTATSFLARTYSHLKFDHLGLSNTLAIDRTGSNKKH